MFERESGTSRKRPTRRLSTLHCCLHPLIHDSPTSRSTANQCFQLAAEYSADIGDLGKAIELYEQVGDWSLSSPLTKYSVKEYWLRAALCSMAMGVSKKMNVIVVICKHSSDQARRFRVAGPGDVSTTIAVILPERRHFPLHSGSQIRTARDGRLRTGRRRGVPGSRVQL